MDKEIITFSATQQTLIKTGGIDCFAGETVKYVEAQFDLGENWSGFDYIDAIWTNDGNFTQIAKTLDPQGVCIVPVEVLSSIGDVRVNLVGVTSEEDVITERLTTYPIFALGVNANVPLSGSETQPITPSQFDQFVAIVIAEVEKVTGMTAQAETLPAGSQATARYENGILYLGIPQGIQGEKGDTGETGNGIASVVYNADYTLTLVFDNGERFTTPPIRGERGPAGADGRDGTDGITPNLSIGNVETLEPTQDAYVTRRGTDDNPIFDFGIPKGQNGTVPDLDLILPTDTASGDIASITDGQSVVPVKSLKVTLEPIQSGSGTPSPDNVRPISGHTEVVTEVCGKNVWDEEWEQGSLNGNTGQPVTNNAWSRSADFISAVGNARYYVYVEGISSTNSCYAFFYRADKSFISSMMFVSSQIVTTPSDCRYIKIQYKRTIGEVGNYNVSINYPSTDTDYHAYDGSVIHTAIEGHYTPVGTNNVPYILRDTPDVDGDRLREKIVGGSVAWNQLCITPYSQTKDGLTYTRGEDGKSLSISGTATAVSYKRFVDVDLTIIGHVYFVDTSKAVSGLQFYNDGGGIATVVGGRNAVGKATASKAFYTRIDSGTEIDITLTPQIIDPTQLFGSIIADYIYSLEQSEAGAGVAFFKSLFPNDYYPYNSGELMSVKTSAHVMTDADENAVTYPLDDIELRGIPKLADGSLYYDGDTYEADGSVTRKYGIVDLGTLTWTYDSANNRFVSSQPYTNAVGASINDTANIKCSKYVASPYAYTSNSEKNLVIAIFANPYIAIRDTAYTNKDQFKASLQGVYLLYELATPTSESATPFEEIQKAFAGGTEAYTDDRTVPIPVGHDTEYLSRVVYGCTIDIVTGECVIDRAMVDLGSLSWSRVGDYFSARTSIKPVATWNTTPNMLCSCYLATYGNNVIGGSHADKVIGQNPAGTELYVADSSYTDATSFKSAVSGQTLVYELATPQTYQLDPQTISLLHGNNNVWSDGSVELTYNADVGLYIDKKLGTSGTRSLTSVRPTLSVSQDPAEDESEDASEEEIK